MKKFNFVSPRAAATAAATATATTPKVELDSTTTGFVSPLKGLIRDASPNGALNSVVDADGIYNIEFDGTFDLKPGVHNLKAKVLWVGVIFEGKPMRMKASQEIWDEIDEVGSLALKGFKGTVEVKSFTDSSNKIRFWSDSETMAFS